MDARRTVPTLQVALVAGLLVLTGCGETSSTPMQVEEAHAQEAGPSERELLLAVLDRLDEMERRFETETEDLRARLDSLQADGTLALAAREPAAAPPDHAQGGGLASDLELVEQRTDSIMALVDFLAQGAARPFAGINVCSGLGISGKADLKSRTEGRAEADGSVGVKPWDTGALAGIKIAQWGYLEFGAGAGLNLGVNGCVDVTKIGTEPPMARAGLVPSGARMAAAPGADRLETTLLGLRDRLGLTASELDRAIATGTDIFESGDLARLAQDLPATLPGPGVFDDPLGTIRSRISAFDPVTLLCDGGSFGSRIQSRVDDACGFIQGDDLPEVANFASLDLGALDALEELKESCGGREVDACMAVLDVRISNVCSSSSSLRSKLADGIFHSNDDFKLWRLFPLNSQGNDNVTVRGVPSTGWNCGELLGP